MSLEIENQARKTRPHSLFSIGEAAQDDVINRAWIGIGFTTAMGLLAENKTENDL
jgi:hypothetical protein